MNSDDLLSALQTQYGSAQFDQYWLAQDWWYYDMVGYAAANSFKFFSQAAGALDPNLNAQKTTEQTNLITPNQIGGAECMVITGIRMFILNSAKVRQKGTNVATDTTFSIRQSAISQLQNAIMSQGVWTLVINQKNWLQQTYPFQRMPAGFGLGDVQPPVSEVTSGASLYGGANAYVSGSPYDIDGGTRGDPFSLGQPVFLSPSTKFQVSLDFPDAASPSPANMYGASNDQAATLWLGCSLCGQLVRPRG